MESKNDHISAVTEKSKQPSNNTQSVATDFFPIIPNECFSQLIFNWSNFKEL